MIGATLGETWPPIHGYPATIKDVHDGDTFTAELDLGFNASETIKIRIALINAPELNKDGGPEARDALRAILGAEGARVYVRSWKHEQSFARWVCAVVVGWPNGVEQDVGTLMVGQGHAVPEEA